MPRTGRPQLGPKLVDGLDASPLAKRRLRAILSTLAGEWTTAQAARSLDCNEACFYALRTRTLAEAVRGLEPRKPGRKPKVVDPKDEEIARLRSELERARRAMQALDVRLELAVAGIRPRRSKKLHTT